MKPTLNIPIVEMASDDDTDAGSRPAVLLVEDNPEMRSYLRKHLVRHYDILEAARGDDGLEAARARLPDLVISDIMMPGLDGHELCRRLKAEPETDFIPVVLLTARTDLGSRLEGLGDGADDYLTKPFEADELLLRLRNLLRMRSRLKALFSGQNQAMPAVSTDSQAPADVAMGERLRRILFIESGDPDFNVPALANRMAMSRAQLHRRLTEVCGVPPAEVMIRFRLDRAARLLLERTGTVGEISDAVGFRNLSHFVRRFRERFGRTPAGYRADAKK